MNGTVRRFTGSDFNYAERLVMSGVPVAHAARMIGVEVSLLAGLRPPPRTSFRSPGQVRRYPCGRIVPDLTPGPCRSDTLATIKAVADRRGFSLADLFGPSSRRPVAYARHEAMAAVRNMGRLSLPQIGRIFGGRDHTTVLAGIRAHEARMAWAGFLVWAGEPSDQLSLFAWAA